MNQTTIIKNLKKCPHFDSCSQNLCPLDFELSLRNGHVQDKCRWMREPLRKKVNGREFVSGGQIMPNGILNFVPSANVERLNDASRASWAELNNR
jgi:hypothetical protein